MAMMMVMLAAFRDTRPAPQEVAVVLHVVVELIVAAGLNIKQQQQLDVVRSHGQIVLWICPRHKNADTV